jgi:outer membrane protein TolC
MSANQVPVVDASLSNADRVQIASLIRNPTKLPSEVHPITLDEAIQCALTQGTVLRDLGGMLISNPASTATVWDSPIVDADPIFGTQGTISEYDLRWSAQLLDSSNDRVFNNITVGGGATELKQDLINGRAGIAKRTWNGTIWEFGHNTIFDNNNRLGNLFNNTWENQLEASVRKPLLRGAGREFNAIAGPNARPGFNFSNGLWIAQLNTELSQADFTMRLEQYVASVEETYWQLYLAFRQHEYAYQNQLLAEQVYRVVRAKYDAQLEGGEADREAEARRVALRFQQLAQQALGGGANLRGIYSNELALRQLIGWDINDPTLLQPITAPPSAPVQHDVSYAVNCGKNRRPEIEKQRITIRQEELRLLAAKNFALPQVDLISRYRLRGFGDDLWGNGPRFSSAWQDIQSLDHQEWDFGLEMNAPAFQRQARIGIQSSQLRLARAHAVLREQERAIDFAITDAIQRSHANSENIRLAEAICLAARQRVDATQALFAMDRIPLERVLEAQESLQAAAEQWEISKIEYAQTIREVLRQSGNYLTEFSIRMPPP